MVTVIAGGYNNTKKHKITSFSETVGFQDSTEFEAGSRDSIKPGQPKWANYVKGCIATFMSEFTTLFIFLKSFY